MSKLSNYSTAAGVLISHEWGHWLTSCSHMGGNAFVESGNPNDCGNRGLMAPGGSIFHGAPSVQMNPQNPNFQFTPKQADAIQQKCKSLRGH